MLKSPRFMLTALLKLPFFAVMLDTEQKCLQTEVAPTQGQGHAGGERTVRGEEKSVLTKRTATPQGDGHVLARRGAGSGFRAVGISEYEGGGGTLRVDEREGEESVDLQRG